MDQPSPSPAPLGANPLLPARSFWTLLLLLIAFSVLALRLLILISHYAVNVFFMDQWDIADATLFQRHSLWEMFRWQHGPHRQGLGSLLAYLIEPFFHWSSRSESFLAAALVVFAALCALVLKYRLFGSFSIFDICIPLIFFMPLQYESLVVSANLAHGPLPIALVLLFCLAWTIDSLPLRYAMLLLINFVSIYTAFAFFLGLITPIAIAADFWLRPKNSPRAKYPALLAVALSLLSLASFFVHYVFDSSADCRPNLFTAPWAFAKFLLLILANIFGVKGTAFFPLLCGTVVLAALLCALLAAVFHLGPQSSEDHRQPSAWVVAILIAYALLFAGNAAYGRSCLGPQVAQVSRYVIYMELGVLGFYFALLLLPQSTLRLAALAILSAVLLATIPLRSEDRQVLEFCRAAKLGWRACYLAIEDIRQCNHAVGYGVYPWVTPEFKSKLDFLKRTRQNLYVDAPR